MYSKYHLVIFNYEWIWINSNIWKYCAYHWIDQKGYCNHWCLNISFYMYVLYAFHCVPYTFDMMFYVFRVPIEIWIIYNCSECLIEMYIVIHLQNKMLKWLPYDNQGCTTIYYYQDRDMNCIEMFARYASNNPMGRRGVSMRVIHYYYIIIMLSHYVSIYYSICKHFITIIHTHTKCTHNTPHYLIHVTMYAFMQLYLKYILNCTMQHCYVFAYIHLHCTIIIYI